MPTLRYSTDQNSQFSVEINVAAYWRSASIRWNGIVVCESATKDQLREGLTFTSNDGQCLTISMSDKPIALPEVQVDDKLYVLAVQDHPKLVKNGKSVLLIAMIGNIGFALYDLFMFSDELQGNVPPTLYAGVTFVALWLWAMRAPQWPLAVGAAIFAVHIAMIFAADEFSGSNVQWIAIALRIAFLIWLIRGSMAASVIARRYPAYTPAEQSGQSR